MSCLSYMTRKMNYIHAFCFTISMMKWSIWVVTRTILIDCMLDIVYKKIVSFWWI